MEFSRWWKIYMCYAFQQKGCEKISSGREMRVRRRNNPRRKRGAKATSFINHSNQLTTACKNRWVNFFQVFPYGRVTRGTKWRHWGRARKDSQRVPSERVNRTRERGQERGISLVGCLWNCNSILVYTLDRPTKRKILISADGGEGKFAFTSRGKEGESFDIFSRLNSYMLYSCHQLLLLFPVNSGRRKKMLWYPTIW